MLLERQHELDLLNDAIAAALDGRGTIAFVVGEAGIGKTSLVSEFASETAVEGRVRVLRSAFEDLSAPEALGLLREIGLVDPAALDGAIDGESRLALFAEVLARLTTQPTLLIVEDLHWADDASMDLIRYLGRRVGDWPLMMLVTSRNEEAGARGRLQRALADIPAEHRTRIDLARLSAEAVFDWASRLGKDSTGLHNVSGGNPLLVNELLAADGASAMIDDLVIARAEALSPEGRDVLDRCSTVPRQVSFELADRLGLADSGVAECLSAGLLVERPDALAFRHELTRRAVEQALSPMRRRRLHREILALLEDMGASAARLLHHAHAAGEWDAVKVLAPAAARQASALGSHREAEAAWRMLLQSEHQLDDAELAACLQGLAYECHLNGKAGESVEMVDRAIELHARRGDLRNQGDCLRWKSRFLFVDGRFNDAKKFVELACEALEPLGPGVELAMAYSSSSQLAMLEDLADHAIEWGEKARDMARALGQHDIEAHALNNIGAALHTRDPGRSVEMLKQSQALCLKHGLQEEYCRALTNHYSTLCLSRQPHESISVAARCIDYTVHNDIDLFLRYSLGYTAMAEVMIGEWDAAKGHAERAIADGEGTRLSRNPAVRAACQLAIRCGDDAMPFLGELSEHVALGRERQRFQAFVLLAAEYGWTTGDPSFAPDRLLEEAWAGQVADTEPWELADLWFWRRKMTGSDDLPAFGPLPAPYAMLREGNIAGAAVETERRGLAFLTALFLAEGDEDQSQRSLRMLDRLGATATMDRIRADLNARGIRAGTRGPRKSTRENSHGITKRELDVLTLIDQGLTNKDIGEKLFVSAKTVDHHVSSLLAKLGARNRSEAAAKGRASGLF